MLGKRMNSFSSVTKRARMVCADAMAETIGFTDPTGASNVDSTEYWSMEHRGSLFWGRPRLAKAQASPTALIRESMIIRNAWFIPAEEFPCECDPSELHGVRDWGDLDERCIDLPYQ